MFIKKILIVFWSCHKIFGERWLFPWWYYRRGVIYENVKYERMNSKVCLDDRQIATCPSFTKVFGIAQVSKEKDVKAWNLAATVPLQSKLRQKNHRIQISDPTFKNILIVLFWTAVWNKHCQALHLFSSKVTQQIIFFFQTWKLLYCLNSYNWQSLPYPSKWFARDSHKSSLLPRDFRWQNSK